MGKGLYSEQKQASGPGLLRGKYRVRLLRWPEGSSGFPASIGHDLRITIAMVIVVLCVKSLKRSVGSQVAP